MLLLIWLMCMVLLWFAMVAIGVVATVVGV